VQQVQIGPVHFVTDEHIPVRRWHAMIAPPQPPGTEHGKPTRAALCGAAPPVHVEGCLQGGENGMVRYYPAPYQTVGYWDREEPAVPPWREPICRECATFAIVRERLEAADAIQYIEPSPEARRVYRGQAAYDPDYDEYGYAPGRGPGICTCPCAACRDCEGD